MKTWEVHWWGERRGSCLVTAESLDEAKAFLEGREFYQADSPRLTRYEELSDEEGLRLRPDVGSEDGEDREDQRERRDDEAEDVQPHRLPRLLGGISSLLGGLAALPRELFVVTAGVLAEGLQLGAVQLYRLAQEPGRLGLDGLDARDDLGRRGGVLDVL